MEKRTKSAFIAHAVVNGLSLQTVTKAPLAEIEKALEGAAPYQGERDRVEAKGNRLMRHTIKDGKPVVSNLRLEKESTIYYHAGYWIVHSVYEAGAWTPQWTNSIIYA